MKLTELEQVELGLINGGIDLLDAKNKYGQIPPVSLSETLSSWNHSTLLSLAKNAVESNSEALETILDLMNKITSQNEENLEVMNRLTRQSTDLFFNLQNAQAVESVTPNYIDKINLDFTKDIFEKDKTDVLISDKIIGISQKPSTTPIREGMSLDSYVYGQIGVVLTDNSSVNPGFISPVHGVNSGHKFYIESKTKFYTENRKFEVVFDRFRKRPINQIDLSMEESHIVEIHSSEDGINFKPVIAERTYIKTGVIPFPENKDRFLKLVFYKNSQLKHVASGGFYVYRINFDYLYVSGICINDKSQFITVPIDPQISSISGLSLDVCDNYTNPSVNISYYIDFNNQEDWKEIKPIGKAKNDKRLIKSFIRTNDFYMNKILKLDYEVADLNTEYFQYQVDLESEFLESNQVQVFRKLLDASESSWKQIDNFYYAWGILNERDTIKVGDEPLWINGVAHINEDVSLGAGVYEFKILKDFYHYVFNPFALTIKEVDSTGLYSLEDQQMNRSYVQDPYYPYNLKLNVERATDFIFADKLIEGKDFVIDRVDGTNKIRSLIRDHLYLAYRILAEEAQGFTFRIKGVYESLDKVTIPYTQRILVRII